MIEEVIEKVPCHYHESQYTQPDLARDYVANEGFLHHFQNLDQEHYYNISLCMSKVLNDM